MVTQRVRGRMADAGVLATQYPSKDILSLTVLTVSLLQKVLSINFHIILQNKFQLLFQVGEEREHWPRTVRRYKGKEAQLSLIHITDPTRLS